MASVARYRNRTGGKLDDGLATTNDNNNKDSPAKRTGVKRTNWTCRRVFASLMTSLVTILLIIYVWPCQLKILSVTYKDPPSFIGPLEPNTKLAAARMWHYNEVIGPESIVVRGDTVYTGTADGRILQIKGSEVKTLAVLGKPPCGSPEHEPTCGRPLGVAIEPIRGRLVVVDAHLGVFRINLTDGIVEQLFNSSQPIDGVTMKFLNDVTIAADDTIYVSVSSISNVRAEYLMSAWGMAKDGRILTYDESTGRMRVVCDNVRNANGIEMAWENDSVIFSLTADASLARCYVTGPRTGQTEVVADNLPGYPDNIRRSSNGGYWLAITMPRFPGSLRPFERMSQYPALKMMAYKVYCILRTLPMMPRSKAGKKYGLILELNRTWDIIGSMHDPSGTIGGVSHVTESNGFLYLGSQTRPYIGVLKLQDVV